MPGPKPPEWWLTLEPKETRPSAAERHKPYLGLREPRFLRGYPMPIRSMIQRHGGAIRRKLLRQKRPRRHARAPKGAKTGLDVQMSMEARASKEVNGSLEERIFYQALIDNGFNPGADFDFQANEFGGRAELGGLVADFLFEYPKLVVQVQSYWHLINAEIEQRDLDQTAMLQSLGYSVLQLWPDVIHSQARLDWWIEQNISHLWGTSSRPTVGQNTRDEAYAEGFGMYQEMMKQLDAITREWRGIDAINRLEKLESALFGAGSGPEITISSASIARILSSANYELGHSGWRIQQSGDAEFNNIQLRGMLRASAFELNTTTGVGGDLVVAFASILTTDAKAADTVLYVESPYVVAPNNFVEFRTGLDQREIMKVTAIGEGSITVVRAQGGTTALAWDKGTGFVKRGDRLHIYTTTESAGDLSFESYNTVMGVKFNWNEAIAQGFTPVSDDLIAEVQFRRTVSPGYIYPRCSVEICADNGGQPGSSLGIAYVPRVSGGAAVQWSSVVFTPYVVVSPSTLYWIVVTPLENTGTSDQVNVCALNTNPYAGGQVKLRLSGGSWSSYPNNDLCFKIQFRTEASRLDVIDWTGPAFDDEALKTRLGRLDGTSDPYMTPTGYGLYSANAFLSGTAVFGSGAVTLDTSGITIAEGAAVQNKLVWYDATESFAPAEIYGESFLDSVYHGRVIIKAADKAAAAVLNLKLDTKQEALILDGDASYQNKEQSSAPATPASGYRGLYAKADGWYDIDDVGVSTKIGAGAGGGSGPLLWLGW